MRTHTGCHLKFSREYGTVGEMCDLRGFWYSESRRVFIPYHIKGVFPVHSVKENDLVSDTYEAYLPLLRSPRMAELVRGIKVLDI